MLSAMSSIPRPTTLTRAQVATARAIFSALGAPWAAPGSVALPDAPEVRIYDLTRQICAKDLALFPSTTRRGEMHFFTHDIELTVTREGGALIELLKPSGHLHHDHVPARGRVARARQ